jgi:predicted RNase H-like HicB family nuclease
MKAYRIIVEREDEWYVARALEDTSVFTQGQSLDEITENIREVAELLHGERKV